MNFPIQANGAEMLRVACILATEAGIKVCAPVHDAILIEAPVTEIEKVVEQTQKIMEEASVIVLGGFKLRSDAEIFTDRYCDQRGEKMWNQVQKVLNNLLEGESSRDRLGVSSRDR